MEKITDKGIRTEIVIFIFETQFQEYVDSIDQVTNLLWPGIELNVLKQQASEEPASAFWCLGLENHASLTPFYL